MVKPIDFHGLFAHWVGHIHGMQSVVNDERLRQQIIYTLIVTLGIG